MADDDIDVDDLADPGRPGADRTSGNGRGRWIWFLMGTALGVAATLLVPRYLTPYLPPALGGGLVQVSGQVLDKQRESGRLLLTLDSDRGAMLATFRDRISELDLLIGRGDSLELAMAEFRPFVDGPRLRGVKKGDWEGRVPPAPRGAAGTDTPGASGAEDRRPAGGTGPKAGDDTAPGPDDGTPDTLERAPPGDTAPPPSIL